MSVFIDQRFPLGRFNATRWRQSLFEDPFGEWPPSPWRFLRALAARWIQYARETGDEDEEKRDNLLRQLARVPPSFRLPASTWRPDSVPRQYHRTAIEWTAKGAKDPAYKKPMSSLVYDRFQAVSPIEPLYWIWDSLELSPELQQLLGDLTKRITYFGRAESHCRMRLCDELPQGVMQNCELIAENTNSGSPVLAANPNVEVNLESLMAATDAKEVAGMTTPPTAAWFRANLPERPRVNGARPSRKLHADDTRIVQFAVGGRVYPTVEHWTRVTSWFRGRVLKQLARHHDANSFSELPPQLRLRYCGISGKDEHGKPLAGHQHCYFCLNPDESGFPTRLICFRDSPFLIEELEAIYDAARRPFGWRGHGDGRSSNDEWQLQMVPLPLQTGPPSAFGSVSTTEWVSLTPFVPPGLRHRFRKGKQRPGETALALAGKLLEMAEFPSCEVHELESNAEWVAVHEPARERHDRRTEWTRNIRRGYRLRLSFDQSVSGPICIGHSEHFGLGLFQPYLEE